MSNKIVVFDTETTGKYDFRAGIEAHHQPHLVQLAAAVFDGTGTRRCAFCILVKPDGWSIPKEASAIHGITTETASDFGLPLVTALSLFQQCCSGASRLVAHNIDFDAAVLSTEYYRAGIVSLCPLDNIETYCTMRHGTNLCKLPGNYGDYKWPKLLELHQQLFGAGFDGAHDAMADVCATARCYFAMSKNETAQVHPR